jgi:hypothetical protein
VFFAKIVHVQHERAHDQSAQYDLTFFMRSSGWLQFFIKGISGLGPSLPAFLTPNVLETLVKNFDIKTIATPDEDLKAILG